MLILTRLKGQSILLGDDIEITIIAIEGKRIRIGITADKSINIVRSELLPPEEKKVA